MGNFQTARIFSSDKDNSYIAFQMQWKILRLLRGFDKSFGYLVIRQWFGKKIIYEISLRFQITVILIKTYYLNLSIASK